MIKYKFRSVQVECIWKKRNKINFWSVAMCYPKGLSVAMVCWIYCLKTMTVNPTGWRVLNIESYSLKVKCFWPKNFMMFTVQYLINGKDDLFSLKMFNFESCRTERCQFDSFWLTRSDVESVWSDRCQFDSFWLTRSMLNPIGRTDVQLNPIGLTV